MREELDQALVRKYPGIFRDRYGDARQTAMCWGFDCGDGWYDIIDSLCAVIENHERNNKLNDVVMPPVIATQVKEKYGTLRFYYTGGDDYVDGVVALAEYMSGVTCETCGAPGTTRGTGWVRTLCDQHADEQGYD
jgi:hypothetical protein